MYCFQVLSTPSFINHTIMRGCTAECEDMEATLLTRCLNKPHVKAVRHSPFCFHPLPSRSSLRFTCPSFFEIFLPIFVPVNMPLAAQTKPKSLCVMAWCAVCMVLKNVHFNYLTVFCNQSSDTKGFPFRNAYRFQERLLCQITNKIQRVGW